MKQLLSSEDCCPLDKAYELLSRLQKNSDCCEKDSVQLSPLAIAENYYRGNDDAYGIPGFYFRGLCSGPIRNFPLLIKCLSAIPSASIVHEILLLVIWSLSSDDEMDGLANELLSVSPSSDFSILTIVAISIRSAVDAMNIGQPDKTNYFLHRLIQSLTQHGNQLLLFLILGVVIYELRGDVKRSNINPHDHLIDEFEFLMQMVAQKDFVVDQDQFSFVFGLTGSDQSEVRKFEETGLVDNPRRELYAQALIAAVLSDLKFDPSYKKQLAARALAFAEIPVSLWQHDGGYVLPFCIGSVIAADDDVSKTWWSLRAFCNQMLYRDFHGGGLNTHHSVTVACDIYLRTAVSIIESLISAGEKASPLDVLIFRIKFAIREGSIV